MDELLIYDISFISGIKFTVKELAEGEINQQQILYQDSQAYILMAKETQL
jgi:hypothetical protein